ncbi:MAG: succinate dehydrogenase assembly factor 2, partial [Methylococcaceae bacterium]|nr:succinate dehydrogenase assembly factor 2 [Methylococcaceae bacterium]
RRGMRELDILLSGYLSTRYPRAACDEREWFHRLLETSDDTLWRYFYQDLTPEEPTLAALVETIRRTAAPHS